MNNYFRTKLIAFISLIVLTSICGAEPLNNKLVLKKGDVISHQQDNGDWNIVKILEIDKWPDGTYTAHCLTYNPTDLKPEWNKIEALEVFAYHSPIDAASFSSGWNLIGNSVPKKSELVGFVEYLKLTDFQRYAEVSNLDINELVSEANLNYKNAITAGEIGNHKDAIVLYSKAIDLFPLFYEAIDNRGFTYMDIGEYKNAIDDFKESLRVNPDGLSAFFSIGECLLIMGQYIKAMQVFDEGKSKFPDREELFQDFYNKAESLSVNG
ncbi:MAG: tetratricopeptide repeat protein [Saccharospirillaceae bacterium]|nr:tetratricopeptide repeat protein [Pseudomonadales bacterium]NRB81277.1 tetratricopeptide repeat protein [Saccharospirillaceae bacterium]